MDFFWSPSDLSPFLFSRLSFLQKTKTNKPDHVKTEGLEKGSFLIPATHSSERRDHAYRNTGTQFEVAFTKNMIREPQN